MEGVVYLRKVEVVEEDKIREVEVEEAGTRLMVVAVVCHSSHVCDRS